MSDKAAKQRVWDLPTRLFHWLLVALIGFNWWSGKNDELELHVWSGIAILTLLVFRLLWGFVGSSTARFASFVRGPKAVMGYFAGTWRGIGHNPLGALSVLGLLLVTATQVGLGLFATDEDGLVSGPLATLISIDASSEVGEIHHKFFNVLLIFIGVHVAAILCYAVFRRKDLTGPMITGDAELDPGAQPMRPAKWWVALLCLAIALGFSRWIVAGAPPFSS